MGFVIGTLVGFGALLIFIAALEPRAIHPPEVNWRWIGVNILPVVVSALTGFGIAVALTNSAVMAGCIGILAGTVPYGIRHSLASRRKEELRAAWPEVLDELVGSVRAGMTIGDALAGLSLRGPLIMRAPFTDFALQLRSTGRLDPCLDELKARLADPMGDRIIEALRLAHDLGGRDLAGMLSTLATLVREDNRARGELLARQSWTVNGARLAAVAPWILLMLLSTRPGTVDAFANPGGAIVLLLGLVMTVIAYILMVRLGQLPEEQRIFGKDAAYA